MREPPAQGTTRQRPLRKCTEQEQERSEGWPLCGRAAPLSVSIAEGARVTLHLGPQLLCGVCDISPCDGNRQGSLTGGTPSLASTHQFPQELDASVCPSGWGARIGPKTTAPPTQLPTSTHFPAQVMPFLSPTLQKRNGI